MRTPVVATTLGAARALGVPGEGPYRSLLVVGRGGMGNVEVALEHGPGGLERIVALKRLLPESASDARRKEMFLREAHLASLIAHRNVVHTFAYGELDGELFLTMEYVEGEPLSRVLAVSDEVRRTRAPRLEPSLVAHVLAEVCEGLHAAHELRDASGRPLHVIHRDVSPHNVMIAHDGRVKLLDFGVAKFEASGQQTRTGEVKGKMAYMSPEQALGETVDRRTDLFSVGAVLFECLTGARMWGAGTDLEIMRRLALQTPPRLDVAWPEAPQALVELHGRLVARDPQRRPATAVVVAEELRAFAGSHAARPGDVTLRELMLQRFGAQQQQRRALLMQALETAAPSRVAPLRGSLQGAAVRVGAQRTTQPTPEVRPGPSLPLGPSAPWRLGAVVLAAISLAAAAGIAWSTKANGHRAYAGSTATAAGATSVFSGPSTGAPPASGGSTITPAPMASAIPSAIDRPASSGPMRRSGSTGISPFANHAAPNLSAAPRPPLQPPQPALPLPTPSKVPDVDPTPF
ncbi:MAG: serine/threonine protein kinase [Myxococcota bacterium]|nr:serine/threonine protein kinase [Myxococcota bacterium]